ncbi:MAG TPA: DEAD/DEAH box helicase family protein, partial [Candidatus Krumholzibacterium sp.]|nr:DEAD/DEAH box helicase family protein [Candidatus Krumholzibacterium sp.]
VPFVGPIRNALTFPISGGTSIISALEETDTHYVVPREYIPFSEWSDLDFPIEDRTFSNFPKVKVRCSASPRDVIQREAHQALLEHGNGVLALACGKGKTVVSIMAWCDLETPALIVVHTRDLMKQWKERILEFTSLKEEDIGIYQGQKEDWQKPVCIAMLKTLALRSREFSLPDGFQEHFGVVIYDEVHNIGAPFFHDCASVGRGLRWGLSATHEREDGLDALYKYHLGPVVYENLEQDIVPETYFVRLDTTIPFDIIPTLKDRTGELNLAKLQTWLAGLPGRNADISKTIQNALNDDRKILCLSNRVEQIDLLTEQFGELASKIHGSVGKEREGALHRTDLVFATTSLAKEGLDRKDLDTAMLLLPVTRESMFRQILGRIQRSSKDKRVPVFVVFEDKNIKACVNMCRKLRKHLTSFGYPFHMIDA